MCVGGAGVSDFAGMKPKITHSFNRIQIQVMTSANKLILNSLFCVVVFYISFRFELLLILFVRVSNAVLKKYTDKAYQGGGTWVLDQNFYGT